MTPLDCLKKVPVTSGLSSKDRQEILAFVLGISKSELFFSLKQVSFELFNQFQSLCEKRSSGCPLAYIIGTQPFYDSNILVSKDVLVPRVETELLVDKVLGRTSANKESTVLDLCCGSGCVGISIKANRPNARVFCSDISEKAIELTKKNAELNSVEITPLIGDFLEPFKGKMADVIVCNPPYISLGEYLELDHQVRDFEPRIALVGGEDGLEYYRRLEMQLSEFLKPGGLAAFEIGHLQAESVSKIFSPNSSFTNLRVEQDLSGKDRFFFLEAQ